MCQCALSVGCFNFERVEVWIFRLFGRCFKPAVWDGDPNAVSYSPEGGGMSSEPTVWDGDKRRYSSGFARPSSSSKPTVWDGDTYSSGEYAGSGRSSEPTKPTAWDDDRERLARESKSP
jgi:hypothetical protein